MNNVIEPTQSNLSTSILNKRNEMITLGMRFGFTDKRTIKCSQQLDELLNLCANQKQFCATHQL
ncbi:aspartyl-phosphate phosphatase Spo0E family protein [Halobacillus seohaensis]|uniref:Aspartyl-phosphate phosphatase Spo0E family protein n=1 Tax=Halobacillus seohaensis TaxID=447421 RepID=A0ABW2EPA7_9BACI